VINGQSAQAARQQDVHKRRRRRRRRRRRKVGYLLRLSAMQTCDEIAGHLSFAE